AVAPEAVTVAAAGGADAERFRHFLVVLDLRGRVARMPHFNAAHSLVDHFVKAFVEIVQTRVRDHGHAAGTLDVADGFGSFHAITLHVGWFAAFQEAVEGFFY